MIWLVLLALSPFCQAPATAGNPAPAQIPASAVQAATPAAVGEALNSARERFASAVTNGRLKGFNDRRGVVAFKPLRRGGSDHRPGPMEDDVIASTLRGCMVADPALAGLGLNVSSQAGKVIFAGKPQDSAALARLIVLALGLDGVTRVRADLPANLRIQS